MTDARTSRSGGQPLLSLRAVLLVGGLGTRLRPVVPTQPKPLADVGTRPFLELLLCQLRGQGIRHVLLCTGYCGAEIAHRLQDGARWDLVLEYSQEPYALGTAGAVKLAQPRLQEASEFLVMNGDSFMEVDFGELVRFHYSRGALVSMVVVRQQAATRYGRVAVDDRGRVTAFVEKHASDQAGLVNAGVYVFDKRIFEYLPTGPASLERNVFPGLLKHGVYALEQRGLFIDIGTPEDYARAQRISRSLYDAALGRAHGRATQKGTA